MTDCKMFALVPAVAATVLNGKTICTARAVIRRECSSTKAKSRYGAARRYVRKAAF